ncbi:MAG: nucleoside hydrolase [Chloroflexota bacterium]
MSTTLRRIFGVAGLAGSAMGITALLGNTLGLFNNLPAIALYIVAVLGIVLSVAGLLAKGKGRMGWLGYAGLALTLLGVLGISAGALLSSTSAFGSSEWAWYVFLVSVLVTSVGMALYGIGALVSGVLPAWAGVPLATGGLSSALMIVMLIAIGDNLPDGTWVVTSAITLALACLALAGWAAASSTLLLKEKGSSDTPDAPSTAAGPVRGGHARWVLVPVLAALATVLATATYISAQASGPTPTTQSPTGNYVPSTPSATRMPSAGAHPVVIDTDMALDDMVAILYLLRRDDVRVEAITVVGTGEVHCAAGVRNARGLLALSGYPQVPVACGSETALGGGHSFPDDWRRSADAAYGLALPEVAGNSTRLSAPDLLLSIAARNPGKLTLLALGPLTNVAGALQSDPSLATELDAVYMMGGAVDVAGNVLVAGQDKSYAEWNIYADPASAGVVFDAGLPITLVPLDATNHVPVTAALLDKMAGSHVTPEAAFVYALYDSNRALVLQEYAMWDTFAAALLTDNSLGTFRTMKLQVRQNGSEIGRTAPSAQGKQMRVAVSAEQVRFEELFLDTLNGGGR